MGSRSYWAVTYMKCARVWIKYGATMLEFAVVSGSLKQRGWCRRNQNQPPTDSKICILYIKYKIYIKHIWYTPLYPTTIIILFIVTPPPHGHQNIQLVFLPSTNPKIVVHPDLINIHVISCAIKFLYLYPPSWRVWSRCTRTVPSGTIITYQTNPKKWTNTPFLFLFKVNY